MWLEPADTAAWKNRDALISEQNGGEHHRGTGSSEFTKQGPTRLGATAGHSARFRGGTAGKLGEISWRCGGHENKGNILGFQVKKPRVQFFDTALGQPLFWAERKSVAFWKSIFADLNVGTVVDTTPGSGTAATAALQMGISYVGIARNSLHANFLSNVLDRHALHMMRTTGSALRGSTTRG